ncbi:substrate-binding domain-containing protein [Marinomonas sp. 2405UD68-3]|uniref:substrate-binding domain-containing protein n=1 Tax=Marinomonas sp. 2405UD68-3 TaxID=3391835 RepID=UPI0039C9780F
MISIVSFLSSHLDLSSNDIIVYNKEFTHSTVAAYIASNMADASFGVKQVAHQFGLRFISICTEDYVFVYHQTNLNKASIAELI